MAGSLFVVATPIGNLEDLTFRALRILKEVDVIAAEDTRRTSKLLSHYGISKPLVSLHEHNEHRESPKLVERLVRGESIALVSDAGTPGISDPGTTLVRLCRQQGLAVVPVPGPSAVTAALSVSGWPATPFTFMGFPPTSGQARGGWFDKLGETPGVVVFFESPHRIRRTVCEYGERYPNRPIIVHREITKIHETSAEWANSINGPNEITERGEFVLVVGPLEVESRPDWPPELILSIFESLQTVPALSEDQCQRAVAAVTGLQVSKIKSTIKKQKILVKRQI